VLSLSALYALVIMSWGGRARASDRSPRFASGAEVRVPCMGHAKFASISTGKCDLTLDGRPLVFQESGITLGGRRLHKPRCDQVPCAGEGKERECIVCQLLG